jgi:hypothetical protein
MRSECDQKAIIKQNVSKRQVENGAENDQKARAQNARKTRKKQADRN